MFDLLIAEEANCIGKNSNAFRAISDDDQIRSKKRLFLSATPIKDFDVGFGEIDLPTWIFALIIFLTFFVFMAVLISTTKLIQSLVNNSD